MGDPVPVWPAELPGATHGPLSRIAAGLPTNIGLMHILAQSASPAEAERILQTAFHHLESRDDAAGARRLRAALELLAANPQAFHLVRSVLSGLDHQRHAASERDELAYWAAAFDRAVRAHPEASVALYSLGRPDLLEEATAEIRDWLQERGLISPRTACLDIGCGIGRFELALGPLLARIVGVDISGAMVEIARRRCAGLANVEVRHTSGRDLSGFATGSFDIVLAVDAFPYIVQSGADLAERMLTECARVLCPGGHLLILNYSYRDDLEEDRRELQAFAAKAGLEIVRYGTSEFSLWDGVAFHLRRP